MIFDERTVNGLLEIDDSFKAPDKLLKIMLSDDRGKLFDKFLDVSTDMKYDWFTEYFESEQAQRKTKKQDFTPSSIADLMIRLIGEKATSTYYEPCAGTGGIFIKRWHYNRVHDPVCKLDGRLSIFTYDPCHYWYQLEELSDRALPFLLFNMSIRGVNGVAVQCDSLERTCKDIYFVRNDSDNFQAYSEVFKMPHTDELAEFCNVKWED